MHFTFFSFSDASSFSSEKDEEKKNRWKKHSYWSFQKARHEPVVYY